MKVIIVMGVAGSGKTTIGKLLSDRLQVPFFDADDFHPESNIKKMTSGQSLTDDDRYPWLETLSIKVEEWIKEEGAVLACSALKETYRRQLASRSGGNMNLIYLNADIDAIKKRLEKRENHFFNPKILDSQFEDLEVPDYGLKVDIDQSPDMIVDKIVKYLQDTVT